MAHTITHRADEGIIFTDYIPPVDLAELQGVVMENLALATETGTVLFLGDCRKLAATGSLIDVYQLGELLDHLGVDRRMREALVVTPDPAQKGTFDFFVTVTTNRGIKVRLFAEMDEASEWLRAEGERLGTVPDQS